MYVSQAISQALYGRYYGLSGLDKIDGEASFDLPLNTCKSVIGGVRENYLLLLLLYTHAYRYG